MVNSPDLRWQPFRSTGNVLRRHGGNRRSHYLHTQTRVISLNEFTAVSVTKQAYSCPGEKPVASVIVCTRNRCDDLGVCIDSLLRQDAAFPYEIIVVDNCPDPGRDARAIALGHGVGYVLEPRQGLDFARNRGVSQAAGDLVAFADDDVAVERDWLTNLIEPFADAEIACVTGLNRPLQLDTEAQQVFERFQSLGRGEEPRVFDKSCGGAFFPFGCGTVGAGCNMAFRKEALTSIGLFEESLDVGTPSRGGGDLYAFYRLIRAGHKIAYQPTAIARHRHRRTMPELRRTMFDYGFGHNAYQTRCLLTDKDPVALIFPTIWLFSYHLKQLVRSLLGRGEFPSDLALTQVAGYILGPFGYLQSIRVTSARRAISEEQG